MPSFPSLQLPYPSSWAQDVKYLSSQLGKSLHTANTRARVRVWIRAKVGVRDRVRLGIDGCRFE